jgi:hypothetical protein
MSDQEFLHGAIHGSLLAVISKPHRGYWALLAAAWIWAIWSLRGILARKSKLFLWLDCSCA